MPWKGEMQTPARWPSWTGAGADRVILEARLAAISVRDGDGHLRDLTLSIRQAGLDHDEANRLLILAWETAVEGALEDGLLSLDEENGLAKYADYFSLDQHDLDRNGVQTSLIRKERPCPRLPSKCCDCRPAHTTASSAPVSTQSAKR